MLVARRRDWLGHASAWWVTVSRMSRTSARSRAALLVVTALGLVSGCEGAGQPSPQQDPEPTPSVEAGAPTDGAVTETPEPEPADLTEEMVLATDLPSICDFPAGRLVDGELIFDEDGVTTGITVVDGSVRLGDLDGTDAGGDAAAVLSCDHGGVAWPQVVLLVSEQGEVMGAQDLLDLTGHGRETVDDLWIEDGVVHVQWFAGTSPEDPHAFLPGSASAVLRWDGTAVVAEGLVVRGVTDAWDDLRTALEEGDAPRVDELLADEVPPETLQGLLEGVVDVSCQEEMSTSDPRATGRCTLTFENPGGFVDLGWRMVGWDRWELDEVTSSWAS